MQAPSPSERRVPRSAEFHSADPTRSPRWGSAERGCVSTRWLIRGSLDESPFAPANRPWFAARTSRCGTQMRTWGPRALGPARTEPTAGRRRSARVDPQQRLTSLPEAGDSLRAVRKREPTPRVVGRLPIPAAIGPTPRATGRGPADAGRHTTESKHRSAAETWPRKSSPRPASPSQSRTWGPHRIPAPRIAARRVPPRALPPGKPGRPRWRSPDPSYLPVPGELPGKPTSTGCGDGRTILSSGSAAPTASGASGRTISLS